MVNIVVFFTSNNENIYLKGRALMQMYRIVPQMKRGNSKQLDTIDKHILILHL